MSRLKVTGDAPFEVDLALGPSLPDGRAAAAINPASRTLAATA